MNTNANATSSATPESEVNELKARLAAAEAFLNAPAPAAASTWKDKAKTTGKYIAGAGAVAAATYGGFLVYKKYFSGTAEA